MGPQVPPWRDRLSNAENRKRIRRAIKMAAKAARSNDGSAPRTKTEKNINKNDGVDNKKCQTDITEQHQGVVEWNTKLLLVHRTFEHFLINGLRLCQFKY